MAKAKTKTVALDKYRSEAKIGPFTIELGDDENGDPVDDIVIAPPTGETLLQISETPVSQTRRMLFLICGEQWDRVYELIAGEPYEVIVQLVVDMIDHFNINQGQASLPGGFAASRTS